MNKDKLQKQVSNSKKIVVWLARNASVMLHPYYVFKQVLQRDEKLQILNTSVHSKAELFV